MSKRKAAHAAAASRRAGGPALGGSVLALLVMTWTGAPGDARADTIVLKSGEAIEGAIIDATRNTVVVQRAFGGMRQMPLRDIAEVRIELAQGQRISGQLLGWADGVYRVRSGGQVMRIAEGDILSREAGEEAPTQPQRELPQRPIGPQTVRMAAAPAAPAPGEAAADRAVPAGEQMAAQRPAGEERSPAAGAGPSAAGDEEQPLAAGEDQSPADAEEPSAAGGEEQGLAATDEDPSASGGEEPSAAGGEEQTLAATEDDPSASGGEEPSAAGGEEQPLAADEDQSPTGGEEPSAAGGEEQTLAAADEDQSPAGGEEPSAAGGEEQTLAADEDQSPAASDEKSLAAVEARESPTEDARESLVAVKAFVAPADPGADQMVFRIELSRPAEQTVVLIYGTVEGTAKAGEDFEPKQGIVTLAPGTKSASVLVPLIGQPPGQGEKRFELFLTADSKVAEIVDRRVVATISGAE